MAKKISKPVNKTNKPKKRTIVDIKKIKNSKTKAVKKKVDYMIAHDDKPAEVKPAIVAPAQKTIVDTSTPSVKDNLKKDDDVDTLSQPKIPSKTATPEIKKPTDTPRPVGSLAPIEEEEKHTMGTKTASFGSKKILTLKPKSAPVVLSTPSADAPQNTATPKGSLEPVDEGKDDKNIASNEPQKPADAIPQTTEKNIDNTANATENKEKTTDSKDFFISNIDSGDIDMEGDNKKTTSVVAAQKPAEQKSPAQNTPKPATAGQPQVTQKPTVAAKKKKGFFAFLTKSYGKSDSEFIIQNLALFLTSGINIMTSLDAMKGETKNKQLQESIDELKQQIEDGTPIWRALRNLDLASENTVALIKIGEESGKLTENLNVIANQQQKDRSFRSKVISAMLYPVLVMGMTVVVGLGIAWFILPRLASVFSSMKMQLPWITKAVIWLGKFLSVWGLIAVPAIIIVLGLVFYFVFVYSKTKHIGQAILFQIPGIKDLLLQVEITRFGYVLGTLLDAGIPIGTALGSLKESTTTLSYRKIYEYFTKGIEEGNSFQKCFKSYPKIEKYIPIPVQQMIIASEQTGTLGTTLKKIGEMYEEKTDFSTKNLATIIEPILLFIVWAAVLIVALAVIIPIYGLVGGMNQAAKQTTSSTPAETNAPEATTSPESSATPTATSSAKPKASPSASPSVTPTSETTKKVKILSTETGFLNVRSDPSTSGTIVGTVNPGDEYTYTSVENDWYQIKLSDTVTGWVSGEYVEIVQ